MKTGPRGAPSLSCVPRRLVRHGLREDEALGLGREQDHRRDELDSEPLLVVRLELVLVLELLAGRVELRAGGIEFLSGRVEFCACSEHLAIRSWARRDGRYGAEQHVGRRARRQREQRPGQRRTRRHTRRPPPLNGEPRPGGEPRWSPMTDGDRDGWEGQRPPQSSSSLK